MALKWGSTTIGSDYTVKFNGTEVKKIYWGSTLVWEKASSTACSNCGGSGYITSGCYSCAGWTSGKGDGRCSECRGSGTSQSSTICNYCLGTAASYLCTGCGVTIYVSWFKETGTASSIDYSKSYKCGSCGAYYTNLDDVSSSCSLQACPNDNNLGGTCMGGRLEGECILCGGDGICIYCNGAGSSTDTCPVCNGGGEEGGDTSSD